MLKAWVIIVCIVYLPVTCAEKQFYIGCHGPKEVTLWISPSGYCFRDSVVWCKRLRNCTTFDGNLIIRSTMRTTHPKYNQVKAYFPLLREITGFFAITFYEQRTFDLLPNLSVIRGVNLIGNYALVVYFNGLKWMYFPRLTTILHGGVRIDRNIKLCYAKSVQWKSIVKDRDQSEKFGIVIESNNLNCGSGCYSDSCHAAAGHSDDPIAQYCWGPGNAHDHQCQEFCDNQCALHGCVRGHTNKCCHKECLGGCTSADSTFSCNACKHYRVEATGECVSKCPKTYVLVKNLFCVKSCPNYFLLNGECVKECPAGYLEKANNKCIKCSDPSQCPRVCKLKGEMVDRERYKGALIRVPADIKLKGLSGCTEIIGSLRFELQEGTGNIDDFAKGLKSLRIIRGHIMIRQSPSLRSLDFLSNLNLIDPPKDALIHNRYAVSIYDNVNLKELWNASKPITCTRGKIFAQVNPRLCPREIFKITDQMLYEDKKKVTADVSEHSNGNRVNCDVKRLEMAVEEVTASIDDLFSGHLDVPLSCATEKCVKAKWNFHRDTSSHYILFYTIYYLKLDKGAATDQEFVDDFDQNLQWKTVDEQKPAFDFTSVIKMSTIITSLNAYATYAFYIKEVVSKGEGRTSKIKYLRTTQAIPSPPLGVEASYQSDSSIFLQWRAPDEPNGNIMRYELYWQRASYSFWQDQKSLDWCKRDVKGGVQTKQNLNIGDSSCKANFTCICDAEKEKSKAVQADREAATFMKEFQERINMIIFTKQREADTDEKVITPTQLLLPNKTHVTSTVSIATEKPIVFRQPNANVSGTTFSFLVEGLEYFQDYIFRICACTETSEKGGCAKPGSVITAQCGYAQARTDIHKTADNLASPINVTVQEDTYNITWTPPKQPNAIVLKYDILISYGNNKDDIQYCVQGSSPSFLTRTAPTGNYVVKVRAISPAGNGSWSKPVTFSVVSKEDSKNMSLVLGVSLGAVLLILFLLAFISYYALFKRNIVKGAPGVLYASVNPEYMNSNEVYIADEWELDREKIELLRELGQGSFGMVYGGIAHDIDGVTELRVAVKTVNENASLRDRIEFLQEASIMKAFNCNHVVRLIGVVSQGQPTFVVMELMERGDLKTFLRSRRPEEKGSLFPPKHEEMLQMTAEIADGMAYLAARKFVHRDLAARNCMVAIDFTVKIGDFGMARDIYESDYYRKGGKGLLPVRWMAPESLRDGLFTTASDVWSFGVVLWEIVTLGAQPYQGKSNEEVLHFVLNDGLLDYPPDCDKQMREFMELCWQRDPKNRPSFLEIIRLLEDAVSEDYMACSFYHEMKRKALEDTLCQEGNLLDLLQTPSRSTKRDPLDFMHTASISSSSVDSGTFIDSGKRDPDQMSETNRRSDFDAEQKIDSDGSGSTPKSGKRNCKSLYDNYGTIGDNMRYGDTPIKDFEHSRLIDDKKPPLKLNKIFFAKPVAV
ncbi:putative insulin-like peptide receptor [Hydractinia symbiolongicarpus]|uniref:putative insulin-like peptide receptor n=1 Tax=Hydractinia symbiolongicarpus TaxID=13093 RepID=UPI0025519EB9|nr:putative insulin-like peptide receptor [Hydractinia symbiolongicarpus]